MFSLNIRLLGFSQQPSPTAKSSDLAQSKHNSSIIRLGHTLLDYVAYPMLTMTAYPVTKSYSILKAGVGLAGKATSSAMGVFNKMGNISSKVIHGLRNPTDLCHQELDQFLANFSLKDELKRPRSDSEIKIAKIFLEGFFSRLNLPFYEKITAAILKSMTKEKKADTETCKKIGHFLSKILTDNVIAKTSELVLLTMTNLTSAIQSVEKDSAENKTTLTPTARQDLMMAHLGMSTSFATFKKKAKQEIKLSLGQLIENGYLVGTSKNAFMHFVKKVCFSCVAFVMQMFVKHALESAHDLKTHLMTNTPISQLLAGENKEIVEAYSEVYFWFFLHSVVTKLSDVNNNSQAPNLDQRWNAFIHKLQPILAKSIQGASAKVKTPQKLLIRTISWLGGFSKYEQTPKLLQKFKPSQIINQAVFARFRDCLHK